MKKITVCVLLALLMCLSMAFPSSAASRPDLQSKYDPIIDVLINTPSIPSEYSVGQENTGFLPSEYKYAFYICAFDKINTPITPAGDWIMIFYFNKPYISSDFNAHTYYWNGYDYKTGKYSRRNPVLVENKSFTLSSEPPNNPCRLSYNLGITNFSYVIEDRTTARVYNQDTFSGSYDSKLYIGARPVDTTALQSLITTAKAVQPDNYSITSWQALQSEIQAAESLLSETGYTQSQIDTAKDNLQAALDALRLLPDASALQALINQSEAIQGDVYTNNSYNHLLDMVFAATGLLSGKDYVQSQIENALSNLQAAINGLEILPDISHLENLIVEAEQIEDIGYTETSWNRFMSALAAVRALLQQSSYTQYEIDMALSELQSAISGLKIIVVTPPVDPPYVPDAEYYNVPESAKKYLNIQNGLTPEHLLPAKEAIFNHLNLSRRYGIWVYGISLLPIILIIVIGKFVTNSSDIRALNGSSNYSSIIGGRRPPKQKYTDY